MSLFPKIEKITKDVTVIHFLLMFGYKLFSLYFPLFLVANNLSFHQIGYTYLLIYLSIAIFSPVVGYLSHKINPAILAFLGILGYGAYSLGMILTPLYEQNYFFILFYLWQFFLGFSAALFSTSFRGILMESSLKKPSRAFGWFYSAPFCAASLAPVFGAFFVWKFGFVGVFIFSLIIHFFNALYCIFKLRFPKKDSSSSSLNFFTARKSYISLFKKIKEKEVIFFFIVSFAVLFLAGIYKAFFILFLKDSIGWGQDFILFFIALFSFLFMPIAFWTIKKLGKKNLFKNVFQGGILTGLSTMILGVAPSFLGFFSVLLINFGKSAGELITSSARSGLIHRKLNFHPKEAGVIDAIFRPTGIAIGSLIAGIFVSYLGYELLFIVFGGGVVFVTLVGGFFIFR